MSTKAPHFPEQGITELRFGQTGQQRRRNHAGAGVTWGSEHLPEISFTITRRDAQSSDRAELEAMQCAILSTDPPVAVMTDDEWVSKGVNLLFGARNKDGEARLSQFHGSHREVWIETRRRILERPAGWMTVHHVCGHATTTGVGSGRTGGQRC